jgi:hypothetical protein
VTTAEGNERVTGLDHLDDLAYRADQGVQRSVTDLFGTVSAEELTGLPPGPPDFAARPSVLRRDVAVVVRAFRGHHPGHRPRAKASSMKPSASGWGVGSGELAGAQAELVLSPRGVPHVWTFDDERVTTVAGDASGEELRRMVESFRPVG